MKHKPKIINLISKLICLIVILYVLCYTRVLANELKQDTPLIDVNKMATLQIKYDYDENTPLTDVNFKIYRVASVSSAFDYTLINEFENYPVNCNGLNTAQQWRDLATTLDAYVASDGIIPLMETSTDENGQIEINNLKTGLYLIIGGSKEIEITTYSCEPLLISLPNLNSENTWDYQVEIEPKVNKFDDVSRLYDKQVTLVWDDSRYEDVRPIAVVVRLYRQKVSMNKSMTAYEDIESTMDYELYEEAVLNAENNWTYIFRNLDRKYKYKLIELPIEGYTISINDEGDFYTVTNTYTANNEEVLPQTGQTWWIVPVFAISGILFYVIGYILNKKGKKEYEE